MFKKPAILFGLLFLCFGLAHFFVNAATEAGTDDLLFIPIVNRAQLPRYKIAFIFQADNAETLYVMDADGGAPEPLVTSSSDALSSPTWSPDGQNIGYHQRLFSGSLSYLPYNGGSPFLITNSATDLDGSTSIGEDFAWSPDGQRIVFKAAGNAIDIFVAPLDRSGLINVTNDTAASTINNLDPDWSPDGQRIVFASEARTGTGFVGTIELVNPDGSDRVPIFGPTIGQLQYDPTFSPDGSKIAFLDTSLSSPFGRQLVVMDANGSNVQRFGAPFPFLSGLHWSPDGTQIAFIGDGVMDNIRATAVTLADGSFRQSLLPLDEASQLTWVGNETLVFDAPEGSSQRNLYAHDLAAGQTTPLTNAGFAERYIHPEASPIPLP